MAGISPLDDPENARFAWARYRMMMKWMGLATALIVAGILASMYWLVGMISIHFYIATALGVGATVMLMAALMGLVFLSSGTGHDEAIEDRLERERNA